MVSLLKQETELFKEPTVHLHALQLHKETLGHIAQHEALLIYSFFFYKEQLERMVTAFYKKLFGPKVYKVYSFELLRLLDTWTEPGKPHTNFFTTDSKGNRVPWPTPEYSGEATRGWTSYATHKRFLREIISMVSKGNIELYHWGHNFRDNSDREWDIRRILYDKKLKRFHYEGEAPKPRE